MEQQMKYYQNTKNLWKNKMKKTFYTSLIIIWMTTIFILSNQPATNSTKLSNSFISTTIGNVYKIFNNNVTEEKLIEIQEKYSHPVRKLAHFTIYLILGLLVGLLIKEYNFNNKQIILISLLICFIYAISDEIHQLFINGRSCEIKDIIIDTSGSFIGIILLKLLKIVKNK